MSNIVNENYIYNTKRFGYYKVSGVFYQVDLEKKTAQKISFENMMFDYLMYKNSFIFKKMILTYIRLCSKLFRINSDYINNTQDLDDIEDMFFTQGQLIED